MTAIPILLAGTFLLLSIGLMAARYSLLHPLRINVVLVLYGSHMLFQAVASFYFLLADIGPAAMDYFLACALTAFLIPAGALLADTVFPAGRSCRLTFFYRGLDTRLSVLRAFWVFYLFLLTGGVLVFAGYMREIESAPLVALVAGHLEGESARIARVDAGVGEAGYIYGVGLRFFMPVLFLSGLLGLSVYRGLIKRAACLAGMILAFIYCAWATDKTPVAALFLIAFLVALIRAREIHNTDRTALETMALRKNLKRKRRLLVGAVFLALLVIAYPAFIYMFKPAGQLGLGYVLVSVFERVGYNPAFNSYTAFEAIKTGWPHTYFRDISKLAWLLGWSYIPLSTEIALYKGQAAYVNAPPTAIGTFFVQGGWTVLCVGVIAASGIFRLVENFLVRSGPKSMAILVLYALLLYGAFRFSQASFHTILFTETILPLLLVWAFWVIVRKSLISHDSPSSDAGVVSSASRC